MAEETTAVKAAPKEKRRGAHPLASAAVLLAFAAVLFWWANANGLLPWYTKWQAAKTRSEIETMAKRVGGDWSKLTEGEQKWLDSVTSNHGRMAVMMHGGNRGGGMGGPGGGGTSGGGGRPSGMRSGGMRPGMPGGPPAAMGAGPGMGAPPPGAPGAPGTP